VLTTLRPYHANVHAPKLWSRNGDMQPWKATPQPEIYVYTYIYIYM